MAVPFKSKMMALGSRGRSTARNVASKPRVSSARAYAAKHPGRAAGMGVAGLAAMGGISSGRRGRGVDKTSGRPTGMRRY